LKKSCSNFNNFSIEVNNKLKMEEDKYKEMMLDIIVIKKPEKKIDNN
jgi:hypothetical protein